MPFPQTPMLFRAHLLRLGILMGAMVLSHMPLQAQVPVLVVGSTSHPFSAYYPEILRAEGVNSFQYSDIGLVTTTILANYDIVLLGEIPLTASQVSLLSNWVNGGGKLIAMRPAKQLAGLLGLTDAQSTMSDKYLLVNTASSPGRGIVNQTMQFHGAADLYALNGATAVATLYSTADTATIYPAVTLRTVGTLGGEAAAFTYDLARSIIYTRQGNPAWAGQERDGISPIRSDDLFFGNASFDPKPDWVDPDKVAIPQADEQQRLLANLMIYMNRSRKPLPRLWYLPSFKKAVVVLTGDDHAGGATAPRFNDYKAASPAGCSVNNWECIRGTSYIFTSSPLSNQQAAGFEAEGFEVGLHITTNCGNYTPQSIRSFYQTQLAQWSAKYLSVPAPITNRTHCIAWSDWTSQAETAFENGIRLDTNYYYYPGSWLAQQPGFMTGSAMPMRFARLDGSTIDVYQAVTHMTDESSQTYPSFVNTLLDNAIGPAGYYGVYTANIHTDSNTGNSKILSDAIVNSAKARGVSVISARQMLHWLDGRNASQFTSVNWSGNTLSFRITSGAGATGLTAMVPAVAGETGLSGITANGAPVSYTVEYIKGVFYAVFPGADAQYQAIYGTSGVVVSVSPQTSTVTAGQSLQFTATVAGTANPNVLWYVSPNVGTISSTGRYTAPATLGGINSVTITAVSYADPSKFGTASVNLVPLPATISGVTTTTAPTTATVTWQTDEPTNSRVMYGTAAANLNLQETVGALVTSHTVTLANLTPGSRYYYRVVSTDASGGSVTWPPAENSPATFLATATSSVWNGSAIPDMIDSGDNGGLEIGMKFQSDVPGYVTGIRFYKAVTNTGTHIGNLWSRTGALLARVTFTEETPSGWQEASFSTPVQINANTTYVISYYAPIGRYSANGAGFASAGVVNAPLRALQNGTDGGNGVYRYGTSTAFPTFTYQGDNYWIDVIFASTLGGDTTPPNITAVSVTPGSTTANITWTTNELADAAVIYGTDPAILNGSASGGTTGTAHSVNLAGLSSNRTYYYRITSTDSAGNSATFPNTGSQPNSFTTGTPDSTPPVITNVVTTPGPVKATITWTTNEPSDSTVLYGPSAGSITNAVSDAALVTSHSVIVTGLSPGTTYHFRVSSKDAALNTATSPAPPNTGTFTTTSSISLWERAATPAVGSASDTSAVELGVKFRSDVAGYVAGVRFFKGPNNTGTHTGSLWSSTGTRLATVTFTNETASGWQEAMFASPFAISANTTYVISYYAPVGRYAINTDYFATSGVDNGPLHAPATNVAGGNGVFRYGVSLFPNQTFRAANYWVDVILSASVAPDTTAPVISAVNAAAATSSATITWNTNEPADSRITYGTVETALGPGPADAALVSAHTLTLSGLSPNTTYYYRVQSEDSSGNNSTWPPPASPPASFATSNTTSFWDNSTTPAVLADSDPAAVELGLKFRSDVAGEVRGVRFYKAASNTGLHVGNLWRSDGTLLASVTFTNETASGWQEASFATPVAIQANTTYIVSYHAPNGRYSTNVGYFSSAGIDVGPIHALRNGVDGGNGVYRYGASAFPNQTYSSSNYWVDVVFK